MKTSASTTPNIHRIATERTSAACTLAPIVNRRPRLELHGSSASPEEAAAVIAAIEQFLRDTAPPPVEDVTPVEPVGPGGACAKAWTATPW